MNIDNILLDESIILTSWSQRTGPRPLANANQLVSTAICLTNLDALQQGHDFSFTSGTPIWYHISSKAK